MSDTLKSLQSRLPSPVAKYGYAKPQSSQKLVVYDGSKLPAFLLKHKANPSSYREFLQLNRIGSVFDELQPGLGVVVTNKEESFVKHPEA